MHSNGGMSLTSGWSAAGQGTDHPLSQSLPLAGSGRPVPLARITRLVLLPKLQSQPGAMASLAMMAHIL